MKLESLVELIGSGNTTTVEEEWMRLIETPDLEPGQLAGYDRVLSELCGAGEVSLAEELAWAAIETISSRHTPKETLIAAGPFLLAIGDSGTLRGQVLELYQSAYADQESIEGLLAESGLGGARPVRRALRTLRVCLALKEGDYLAARDEDEAARVEKIDGTSWQFSIVGSDGPETLGPVAVADRYRPASPTEFCVMRRFAPDELIGRLWKDPLPLIIDICKERGNRIASDVLEAIFVPELLTESDWKKWWTRARTVLKRCPNIKIDGRSPCEVRYVDTPVAPENELLEDIEAESDPLSQLEFVEKYVRACKARGQPPSQPALVKCYERFTERARCLSQESVARAGLFWLIARRIGETAGIDGAGVGVVNLFKGPTDPGAIFGQIDSEELLDLACTSLAEARPDDWRTQLLALLPTFPLAACDRAAGHLIDAGYSRDEFQTLVRQIMASPIEHFEALLWLWNGPSRAEHIPVPAPVTLLSRVLRVLDECRRSERIPKETARRIATRARAVLALRAYERFERCLDELKPGMASALRTQIRRLDGLGRAVRDDLLNRLSSKFPPGESASVVPPWARDNVIYVTKAGLAQKQREIENHVNVKMKENSRAIGRAAEHGDLSENSEYKFALEERDLLRARLAQMNAEMGQAQVITADQVPTDHVGVGTKVVFKRTTDGASYELSFVGAWDADSSKGLVNYKAPLASKVMGKRIGDVVEFNHTGAAGSYEIVALENALAR